MAIGLRTLFALRPRAEPVPMAQALEEVKPTTTFTEIVTRDRTRGPQRKAPFEIDLVINSGDGAIWIWPRAMPTNRHV